MPNVIQRFNARQAWKKGIDAVKAQNRQSGLQKARALSEQYRPMVCYFVSKWQDEDPKQVYSR